MTYIILFFIFSASCNPIPGISSIVDFTSSSSNSLSIKSFTPSSGFILGAHKITISGTGFQSGTAVTVGSSNCTSVIINSPTELTCVLPSVSSPTTVNISVTVASSTVIASNNYQYKLDSFNVAELFTGELSHSGSSNGVSSTARFYHPSKPVVIGSYVYISDTENHLIRRMNIATQIVETVAGKDSVSGTTNGIGASARFDYPMGMTAVGTDLYIIDNNSCVIRKLDTTTSNVSLFAGINYNCTASDSSNGLTATFAYPISITHDSNYLYLGDESTTIRRVSLSGSNSVDSLNLDTTLSYAGDLTVIGSTLYYVDTIGSTAADLYSIDLASTPPLTTAALTALTPRSGGLTNDSINIYISSPYTNTFNKYNIASGTLTAIAGSGTAGNVDGLGTAAQLYRPSGLDYSNGLIYFTSFGSHNLRSYSVSSTTVLTLSGNVK